jgi:NUMOD4 motif/HNH endonuclease
MYIKRYYDEEKWKEIELKSPFEERYKMFVSNYGKIKKYNKIGGAEIILSQPKTEGYPSVNITFARKISVEEQEYFSRIRKPIEDLRTEIKNIATEISKCDGHDARYYELSKKFEENQNLFNTLQENYKANYRKHETKRKLTFGGLVHRFVAKAFLPPPPTPEHKLVTHLDFDKDNNHHSNLKWMTQMEVSEHNKNNPLVIKAKARVIGAGRITRQKLTVRQVMIIKKRINEDIPLRHLAKRYKVSETQLLRIKRGINWGNVPAAR